MKVNHLIQDLNISHIISITGTLFSLANANLTYVSFLASLIPDPNGPKPRTDEETENYIASNYFPDASTQDLEQLFAAYPSELSEGSPFDTGSANNLTSQYKRLAAFQGDLVFQAPRRFFLQQRSASQSTWSYCMFNLYKNVIVLISILLSVEARKIHRICWLSEFHTSLLGLNLTDTPHSTTAATS